MKQDPFRSREKYRLDTLQERHPIFGLSCIAIGKFLVVSIIITPIFHSKRVQSAVIAQNEVIDSDYRHLFIQGVEKRRISRVNSDFFWQSDGMNRLNDPQTGMGPGNMVDSHKQHQVQDPISYTENVVTIPNYLKVRSLQIVNNFPGTTIHRADLPVDLLPLVSPGINPKLLSLPSSTSIPGTSPSANLEEISALAPVNINDVQRTSIGLMPSTAQMYSVVVPSTNGDSIAPVATKVMHPNATPKYIKGLASISHPQARILIPPEESPVSFEGTPSAAPLELPVYMIVPPIVSPVYIESTTPNAPLEPPATTDILPSVPPGSSTMETVVLGDDNIGNLFQQKITIGLSVAVLRDSIDAAFITDNASVHDALQEKSDMELEEDITATLQVALGHILTYILSLAALEEINATGQEMESADPDSIQFSSRSKVDMHKKPKIRRYALFWVQGTVDASSIYTLPIEIDNRAKAEIHWVEINFQYIIECNVTEMQKRALKSSESHEKNRFCNISVNVTKVTEMIWSGAQNILNGTLLEWLQRKDSRIVGVCEVGEELETKLNFVIVDELSILFPRRTFGAVLFAFTTVGTTLLCLVANQRKKKREGEIYEWSPRMCDENGVEEFLQIGHGLISQQTSSPGRKMRSQTHATSLESSSEMFTYEQEQIPTIV